MQLEQLNIVAIGGGHGLGRVLSSLSFMGDKLTGIVTTTDNGGSTGRLRKRSSSIAWGDIRNCLTQLVDNNNVGAQLFDFRFDGADELGGHNLGNLILYGLGQINTRPIDAMKLIRRLLKVRTQVLPMSEEPTDLLAFYPQGRCRVGELSVDDMPIMPKNLMLAPLVKAPNQVVKSINNADLIILGPGSFLTSVIPPLLVRDISNALCKTSAHCIFIENIVPEASPAATVSLDYKLEWINDNVGCQPINAVFAQSKDISSEQVEVIDIDLSCLTTPHHHSADKLVAALRDYVSQMVPVATTT